MIDAYIRKRFLLVCVVAVTVAAAVFFFSRTVKPVGNQEGASESASAVEHIAPTTPDPLVISEELAASNPLVQRLKDRVDGVMGDEELSALKGKGILSNTDKSWELIRRDPAVLWMANAIIDTDVIRNGGPNVDIPEAFRASDSTRRHIVVFDKPLSQEQRDRLEALGAHVEGSLPNRAWAITADAKTIDVLRAMPETIHVEPFHPFFKMGSDVQAYLSGDASAEIRDVVEKGDYQLLLFDGEEAREGLDELGVEYTHGTIGGDYEIARVNCDVDLLDDMLRLDGVRWITSKRQNVPMNDTANTTMRARPIKASIPGLDGSGVIVGVCDTGVDFVHRTFSQDPTAPTTTNVNSRIVAYYAQTGGLTSDGIPGDTDGHGTHVAASVLGNGAWSTNVVKAPGSGDAPYSSNHFAGVAYNAKLVMVEDFNSFDATQITWNAYSSGARIANNSWGAAVADYGVDSMTWDFLVRDANNDPVDGQQPYICFFAAGNSGAGNYDGLGGIAGTVGWPGNAKNVITVGALEQRRMANNLVDIMSIESTDADWEIADYSSRGPTPDGRTKPDVVAPGSYVLSAQSHEINPSPDSVPIPTGLRRDFKNNNVDTGPNYMLESGTSMATPLTTGCGALFYQYYTNTFNEPPTPALMKAALINGASSAHSFIYNSLPGSAIFYEGWGMVDLARTIQGPGARSTDQVVFYNEEDAIGVTGEVVTKQFTVSAENVGGLKITLAYSDYPGTPGAGAALVNDLDLVVYGPNGEIYQGNWFVNAPWQMSSLDITEGIDGVIPAFSEATNLFADAINNVEQVLVRHARQGTYRIEIRGTQVPQPTQPFALVIHLGTSSLGVSGGSGAALALDESGFPVLATANYQPGVGFAMGIGEPENTIGLRHWVGPFGKSTEFNTWRILREQWFDYGYDNSPWQEILAGFVLTDTVSMPDVAVGTNGNVYVAWVHDTFDAGEPNCIYVRYTDGTNKLQLGDSYQSEYGICDTGITENAFAPNIVVPSDGNPIVAYIQPILDLNARTLDQEVIVKRWNGSSWVSFDGTPTGIVRKASFAASLDMVLNGDTPVLAWYDLRANTLRSYSWNGSAWYQLGGDFGNRPLTDGRPRLAIHGGVPYATWAEYGIDAQRPQQTAKVGMFNGSAWVGLGSNPTSMEYPGISNTNSPSYTGEPSFNPVIGTDGSTLYVAWQNGLTNNNTINLRTWNGSTWGDMSGSGSNSIIAMKGVSTLKDMVVHPSGLPIISFESTRLGLAKGESMVVAWAGDVTPPVFNGIDYANGTLSNTVDTGWTEAFSGGQVMTYTVYRSPGNWDPADPTIPPSSDPGTIASVFANPVGSITNFNTLTFGGLTADRVWYWGVRVQNASGVEDGNTKIILGGPTSPFGDADNDWLTYNEEVTIGTDPIDRDTDDDGMWDGWEVNHSSMNTGQLNDVGLVPAHTNALSMDPFDNGTDDVSTVTTNDGSAGQGPYDDLDGDGMFNIEEFQWWTNNYLSLGIGARTNAANWLLDPTDPDSDDDGMPDGWEWVNNLNPGDPNDYGPTNPTGPNDDADGDGVSNLDEYLIGGDPWNPDGDQDGLTDLQELLLGTSGNNPDTDGDGLQDGFEVNGSVNGDPTDADSNNNGVSDGEEYELGWTDVGAPRSLTTVILSEDFESGTAPGWTTFSPAVSLWHITSADPDPPPASPIYMTSHTTNYSYRCANDPTQASTNGTYEVPGQLVYSALDSPDAFPAANNTINLFVRWKEWYSTESQWDLCEVLVSPNSGLTWTLARSSVSGTSSGWVSRVADISEFATNPTVRVRFLLRTLNSINNAYQGWYVDDVEIYGGTTVTGTVRDIDGRPIKNATVYAIGSGGLTNRVGEHSYVNPGTVFSEATTDNAGRYRIPGLYQGNYYVKTTYPGYRAEFWNGVLYNTAVPFFTQFGGEINAGVPERWRVNTPANLTAANSTIQCDFEIEKGTARGSALVLSPTVGIPVYLSQQSTNAVIWNGSTNAPLMNAYTTVASVVKTRPDWYTNNLELTGIAPVMIEDLAAGDHVIFFDPPTWSSWPWISRVKLGVRDGESTVVSISSNFVSGELYVLSEGATNDIIIDRKDTGLQTTGTDIPVQISVAAGEHEVILRPSGQNDWIPPKLVTTRSDDRAILRFTSNDLYGARGYINVRTVDIAGRDVRDARVWLDGYEINATNSVEATNGTPVTIFDVREGDHYLTVYKDGFKYSPLRLVSAYSNVTNFVKVTLYEADRDYDYTGDAFEQDGYTNLFLFAGQDDPDGDGLLNQAEYDLFRLDELDVNLADPDSDDDMVMDGVEVAYDGQSNLMALSVLYTNAAVGDSNVWVYFHGRFLEGVNAFNTSLLATTNGMRISLEGDLCLATNLTWVGDQFASPVMRFQVARFGAANRIVDFAHNFNTPVFADMIPDDVDTDGDIMFDGFEYLFENVGNLVPIEAGSELQDPDYDGLTNIDEFLGYDRQANTNDWAYPNTSDTDGDGMPDGWEIEHGLNPRDPTDALTDTDGDGLTAFEEWQVLTDPQNPDSDNDFLTDGLEVTRYFTNPLQPDSDNDGLIDGEEVYDSDLDPNNGIDGGFFPDWNGGDMDLDGDIDGPTDWDTDGDGMPDGFEVKDAWGNPRVGSRLDPTDPTDGALDSDGDGLSNLQEYLVRDQLTGNHPGQFDPIYITALWDYVTDPFNADSDGDGMPDGFEVFNGLHPIDPIPVGVSGLTNEYLRYVPLWRYGDLDLDGVANTNEYGVRFILDPLASSNQLQGSTHPWLPDTDADGLWDGEEFKAFTANPLSQDTDGDGLIDGSGIPGKRGEVNTETIISDAHYDQAFNDMWGLVLNPALPYPLWGYNPQAYNPAGAPSPRWGGELVHIRYRVNDDESGNYVSRPVGGNKVPNRQLLLENNTYVLLGGRDGVTSVNDVWEFYPNYGTWANRGTFPLLLGNEGWSEMVAAVRQRPVHYKHVNTPALVERMTRPRPGGPPAYEFYTDDTNLDPLEIWGEEGVQNWDWNVFVAGWVRPLTAVSTQYHYFVDGINAGLLPAVAGGVADYDMDTTSFYTANWKTMDDTNIVVRYGWEYIDDAYEWSNTTGLAYSQLDDEAAGESGAYIKAGASTTNVLYAGVCIGPVMNTQTDYAFGGVPTVVSARLRLTYAAAAPVNINVLSELGRVSQPTLPTPTPHNTLTSPDTFYTALGQDPLYRPRNRDVNAPKFPPNPWAFNSTVASVPFASTGVGLVTTNIDVTTQFTEAMAANNSGVWEIGNNIGFLFYGNSAAPGFIYIAKRSEELFVDVTTPPYLQAGQWYITPSPVSAPHHRKSGDMVYIAGLDEFMLFGGVDSVRAMNDTWIAPADNMSGWTELEIVGPPARWGHSMLSTGNGALLFGGFDRNNRPLNDLWQFNGASWNEVVPSDGETPQPRAGASFGTFAGFYMLYGGTDGEEYFNDLWVLTAPGMVATNNGGTTNLYTETKWILIQPNGFNSLSPAPRAFAATAHDLTIFGGRRGTIPSGADTDKDGLSDGLEVELGTTSREPRLSPLSGYNLAGNLATGAMNDALAYNYTAIGDAQYSGTPPVCDFESLEGITNDAIGSANLIYAMLLGLPVEGWTGDPNTSTINIGYYWADSSSLGQWWHCFNRSVGTAGDPRDVWELGCPQPRFVTSPGSVPRAAYSGRWCWGTALDGSYPANAIMELYSPQMNFGALSSSSTLYLVFYEWLDLADNNDIVRIDAIIPTTASDVLTRKPGASEPIINILPSRNNFANTTGGWRRVEVALEPIANETNFFLVFTLQSDSAGQAGGWYIDDVAVASGGSITGTYTPGAGSNIYLYAQSGTNAMDSVTTGPGGQFGFDFLPTGNYRLISVTGGTTNFSISGGSWVVTVPSLNVSVPPIVAKADIPVVSGSTPFRVSWNAEPGLSYDVQYTTSQLLASPSPWVTLTTVVATGTEGSYIDMDSVTEESRFYRVILTGVAP